MSALPEDSFARRHLRYGGVSFPLRFMVTPPQADCLTCGEALEFGRSAFFCGEACEIAFSERHGPLIEILKAKLRASLDAAEMQAWEDAPPDPPSHG